MHFKVIAATDPGFERWVEGLRRSGQMLTSRPTNGCRPARQRGEPAYLRGADNDLFDYGAAARNRVGVRRQGAPVDPQIGVCRDMTFTNGVD